MESQIQITHIPLAHIHPSPMNPRKHFDEASIKELSESIREKGVLQPILVRKNKTGYEIVAGERRYRASRITDLETIPAIIRTLNDEEALEIMITENLQRKDIHPMEEAAGFQQLTRIKNFDTKEIAARVGKSPTYVAQRLKLNSLIDIIQQFFFDGHLLVKDALVIATMDVDSQKDLFEDTMSGETGMYELDNWHLRKYQHNLFNAPFDITDPLLNPSLGACGSCQFNTGSDGVLFPEQLDKATCLNRTCFKLKCDKSYGARMDEAKSDPSVVLITGQYNLDQSTRALMKKVDGILEYNDYHQLDEPEYPDRADFDDYTTEKENEDDFQHSVKVYQREKAAFDKQVSSANYIRAFVIGGDNKGKYTYVKLANKSKAAAKSSVKSVVKNEDQASIKSEIDRIRSREKRAIELDDAHSWGELFKLCNPSKIASEIVGGLSQVERDAVACALYHKLSYPGRTKFKSTFKLRDHNGSLIVKGLPLDSLIQMLRFFFVDILPPAVINGEMKGHPLVMKSVLDSYWPKVTAVIYSNQAEYAKKRASRVEARIKSLQAKLKEVSKPKAASPDASKKSTAVKVKRVAGKKPIAKKKVN